MRGLCNPLIMGCFTKGTMLDVSQLRYFTSCGQTLSIVD
ncbi:hypothetical protein KP509_32G000500 [Ceratopteris richardii]|uniref:Uncharacterized protein n=1 Tax=Ceratopteris richardii TaxID=49495 RepID=A0A8T2QSL3_CERRI|nr:hypothetical protein KP509_32G000500 [Ceratopteris richardii]